MSKFRSIITVCVITFTSVLVTKTWQIQHSCDPMIHWSGEFPAECQIATKDNFNSRDREKSPQNISKPQPNNIARDSQASTAPDSQASPSERSKNNTDSESTNQSNPVIKFVNEHTDDIVGGVAGIAGGVGTVAAASATAAFSVPVAGAVLIGLGIWLAIRSIF